MNVTNNAQTISFLTHHNHYYLSTIFLVQVVSKHELLYCGSTSSALCSLGQRGQQAEAADKAAQTKAKAEAQAEVESGLKDPAMYSE